VNEQCTIHSVVDVTTQLHKVDIMENVNKVLDDAIENALKVFADTADALKEADQKASTRRAEAINFIVDCAAIAGLSKAQTVEKIAVEVLNVSANTGDISQSTAYSYKSGLGRALYWGVPWTPSAHKTEEQGGLDPIPADERVGRGKAGAKAKAHRPTTAASLKVDAKKRTVALTVPKSVKPDQFGAAVLAVGSEPGRVALFLAWVKSHGWK
jgi:hypothetical protein